MVKLWRRLVVWLRSLLVALFFKKPIQWSNKLGELFSIIMDALKMQEDKSGTTPKPTPTPEPKKPIPDYNLIPKRPVRDFFKKLLGR
ncbi:MAG: hypothetical protein WC315_03785 [Candidatus Omnitrophota bacterium]|jgi:hypothetical protein